MIRMFTPQYLRVDQPLSSPHRKMPAQSCSSSTDARAPSCGGDLRAWRARWRHRASPGPCWGGGADSGAGRGGAAGGGFPAPDPSGLLASPVRAAALQFEVNARLLPCLPVYCASTAVYSPEASTFFPLIFPLR